MAMSAPSSPANAPSRRRQDIIKTLNLIVLVLSVLLIVYISYDTFRHIPFLDNHSYMVFQFWVCVVFMATFFIELYFAEHKLRYLGRRWFFFLLSIPYLNIIGLFNLQFSPETLYFLRFIPLARGGLAIAIIVGFFTRRRITSVFVTYTAIVILVVYFCSLIIFEREQPVNPQIPDFSAALWFASMVVTTIGCDIAPVTIAGKVLQIILASMGMIMFPLFTVYITSTVIHIRARMDAAAKAAREARAAKTAVAAAPATPASSGNGGKQPDA